jgi:para-nitrobenzyl esterase
MRLFVARFFDLQDGPVTEESYAAAIASLLGVSESAAATLVALYPPPAYATPGLALSALATDAVFACNTLAVDRPLSRYVPTYAYEFNDGDAPQLFLPPVSFPYGATQGSELQYLFGLPSSFPRQQLDADQQQLSQLMARYWTHSGGTTSPTRDTPPLWRLYEETTAKEARMMSLVPPTPSFVSATSIYDDHRCAFWDPLLGN